MDATPEDIMLSYVSGDKSKDRTDRTMVTPWFRFLWETYRNLLDILRHNARLQSLYASSIKRAFAFCVSYKRTSEFRRLCELLRSHLANIQKRAYLGKDQKDRPDLMNVETLQLYVETRFEQLKVGVRQNTSEGWWLLHDGKNGVLCVMGDDPEVLSGVPFCSSQDERIVIVHGCDLFTPSVSPSNLTH